MPPDPHVIRSKTGSHLRLTAMAATTTNRSPRMAITEFTVAPAAHTRPVVNLWTAAIQGKADRTDLLRRGAVHGAHDGDAQRSDAQAAAGSRRDVLHVRGKPVRRGPNQLGVS